MCRGGDIENRFSTRNGFDNPSIYCDAYKVMYQHVCDELVRNGFPAEVIGGEVRHELTARTSLGWLLDPIPVETFIADVWAKTYHVIKRRSPGYFDEVFGAAAVEDFLEYMRPDQAAIRLGRTNKDLDGYRLADGALDLAVIRIVADGYPSS